MTSTEESSKIKSVCPTAKDLSVIVNKVRCEQCNLVFLNEPRFRMHDLKVHKHQKLNKSIKERIQYHCPVESCIYSPKSQKHFTLYKYLKQHYLKVHAEKIFACTSCPKSFSTEAAKEAHARICGISFVCDCQKSFSSYEALLTHARRHQHKIEKYKTNRVPNTSVQQNTVKGNVILNVHILPKPSCSVAVQTDDFKRLKIPKQRVCRQTQTNYSLKGKKSAETQTRGPELNLDNFTSENLFPSSPLPLQHDVGLQDFWEDKSSSGTQTTPDKNLFGDLNYDRIEYGLSRSDPMLTEETFNDRFSSIETQTERAFCRSLFEPDCVSSNNETQTTESFDTLHIYNNTYTQTYDEMLPSDLVLSHIQTQTAWSNLEETVSAETQTKFSGCQSGCANSNDCRSWFATQTNHMETQTDLLHIFEDLE